MLRRGAVTGLLCLVTGIVGLTGCSSDPTEEELEAQARDEIEATVDGLVTLFEPADDSPLSTTPSVIDDTRSPFPMRGMMPRIWTLTY